MLPVPNAIVSQVLSNVPSEFPINKPEVNPPLYDINSLVQPIVASIAQSNNINIPKPQPQIQPQTQPIIITQPQAPIPKQPDSKVISEHIEEQQNKVPEPLPQNQPVEPDVNIKSDILGFKVKDKFDGLKMKNKTLPLSKVGEATLYGLGGGIASGLAGPSLFNNAISTAGAGIGYAVGGDTGGLIGGLIGSGVADKINTSYPSNTLQPERPRSRTRNRPTSTNPDSNKTLATRLYNATFDGSEPKTPVRERIKKSRILTEIEKKHEITFDESDVQPEISTSTTSTLSSMKERAKKMYENIMGKSKSGYTQLSNVGEDEDFTKTLEKSKAEGKKKGTYSLLPTDEEDDVQLIDKRRTKKTQPEDDAARLLNFTPSTPIQTLTQTQTRRERTTPMKELIRQNLTKLSRKALEQEKEKREGSINDKIYLLNLKRSNFNRIVNLGRKAIAEDKAKTYPIPSTLLQSPVIDPNRDRQVTDRRKSIKQQSSSNAPAMSPQFTKAKYEKELNEKTNEISAKALITGLHEVNKEETAKSILQSAFVNKKKRVIARHELNKNAATFNEAEYQEKIRESRKRHQTRLSEDKLRPPKKKTEEYLTKLRQARKSLQSTDLIMKIKPRRGRPPLGNQSRLSTYSNAPTEYEGFGGAAFTPKKK
jgi:hypothetical protein